MLSISSNLKIIFVTLANLFVLIIRGSLSKSETMCFPSTNALNSLLVYKSYLILLFHYHLPILILKALSFNIVCFRLTCL